MNSLLSFRLTQIRVLSKSLEILGCTSAGCAAILWLRRHRLSRLLLRFLVGYRRTFATFAEAEKYASRFGPVGHEHPDNVAYHSAQANVLRESDYPLLFHLAPLAPCLRKVFDLGGNVGNLFYALQAELVFPGNLCWLVLDLPLMRSAGESMARAHEEVRIRFTDSFAGASGADLFLACGCLHYFEQPIDKMLSSLDDPPRRVIINKTPCTRKDSPTLEDLITVQDNHTYLVPCKIHNSTRLVESMRDIGYSLRATWHVYESHLRIPLHPDFSSDRYSGFYFLKPSPRISERSSLPD
jgi:putative methyltransferase (TIGR04325 family)